MTEYNYVDPASSSDNSSSEQPYSDINIGSAFSSNRKKHILEKYADKLNLVDDLTEEQVNKITSRVVYGMEEDRQSQAEWMQQVEQALRLAKLKKEPKNYPLEQSANIKFPLIMDAAYQFAARTYPEFVQDNKIVKLEYFGQDLDPIATQAATLGAEYMNYQLLGPDSEWEAGMDKLLVVLPIIGMVVKKTYYDKLKKKNVSDICNYKDIILRNDPSVQCFADLRRVTHVLHCHPNDLVESARYGLFSEKVVDEILPFYSLNIPDPECTFLEQHCYYDLDDDGYEEPYIATVHQETHKLVSLKARYSADDISFNDEKTKVLCITPIQYFTDYHFLPAPDGSFMSMGFGLFLLHINETVNTILNQLIDAGKLANLQTGFIDARLKLQGNTEVDPGQWNKVKGVMGQTLKEGVLPLNYKEPSNVLYQLLGLLIQTAKELTSSTDMMQGNMPLENVKSGAAMAAFEQGIKRHSAIQKRLYRSVKEELQKLYRLNKENANAEEFYEVTGSKQITPKDVFDNSKIKVFPIADANLSTDAQKMSQAQVIMGLAQQPGINKQECFMRLLQAARIPHPERIIVKNAPQPPNPQIMKVQADAQKHQHDFQIKTRQQDLKEKEFIAKLAKLEAEITQMQAKAVKLMSDAKSDHQKNEIAAHNAALETMKAKIAATTQAHKDIMDTALQAKQLQLEQHQTNLQHQQEMGKQTIQQQQVDNDRNQQDQEEPGESMDEGSGNGEAPESPEGA